MRVFTVYGERVYYMKQTPGLGAACVEWLHAREVRGDRHRHDMVEVWPPEDPAVLFPLHALCIRDMGLTLGRCSTSRPWPRIARATACGVPVFGAAATRGRRRRLAIESRSR